MLDPAFGQKPSLIQRTSSVDTREEITRHTWMSLMSLLEPREFFVTVDHSAIWRKHLSWAKTDGSQLRNYLTQRFGTNMVFMSLLLGAEVNVLFNSSHVTTQMRQDMQQMNHHTPHFWVGIIVICSVVLTLATLLTTFTAWGMVSSISDANTHCVLRSSMGQYVCFLPSRLIVMALYSFLMWVMMFIFILMPHIWSLVLLALISVGFLHIVTVFSAFGRLIMHTGAMGSAPIFDTAFEEELLPRGLHTSLLFKAVDELRKGTSITRQYKSPSRPIGRVDPVEGEKASTAVRFNDEVWDRFPEENLRASVKLDRKYSNSSITDVLPPTALDRWVSQDSLIEVPADQTGGECLLPSPPPESQLSHSTAPLVQSLKGGRPPRIATKTTRPGIEQKSLSDNIVTSRRASAISNPQSLSRSSSAGNSSAPIDERGNVTANSKAENSPRRSFADAMPRPSLLNAGGHTLKSIRRMAASFEEDNGTESPHSKVATFSPLTSSGRKLENDARRHNGSREGSETQRLLPPKPSLRPYSDDSRSQNPKVKSANYRKDHHGAENDSFQSSVLIAPPQPVRVRAGTAEIIDIVSRCVSPKEAEDSSSFESVKEISSVGEEEHENLV